MLRQASGYGAGGGIVIEAKVQSLRKKLGDQASRIETTLGLGYRLREPGVTGADEQRRPRDVPA